MTDFGFYYVFLKLFSKQKFSKEKESFFRKESFKNFSIEFEELKFYYKS